jgi:hypothetical protein
MSCRINLRLGRPAIFWLLGWAVCIEALRVQAVRVKPAAIGQEPNNSLDGIVLERAPSESYSGEDLPSIKDIDLDPVDVNAASIMRIPTMTSPSELDIVVESTTTTVTVAAAAITATTTVTTTVTEDSSPASEDLQLAALDAHNKLRRLHDAPDLKWCHECYLYAKRQANLCQEANKLFYGEFGPNLDQGQNLHWVPKESTSLVDTINGALDQWYEQVHNPGYDFEKNAFQRGTSHFVQVVWKSTTHVGMAISDDGRYVVANYIPKSGEPRMFTQNVSPNKDETTTTTTTTIAADPDPITVKATAWTTKLSNQFNGCRDEAIIKEVQLALARNEQESEEEHKHSVTTVKTTKNGETTLDVLIDDGKGAPWSKTIECRHEIFGGVSPDSI